jgi:hypothetical protein
LAPLSPLWHLSGTGWDGFYFAFHIRNLTFSICNLLRNGGSLRCWMVLLYYFTSSSFSFGCSVMVPVLSFITRMYKGMSVWLPGVFLKLVNWCHTNARNLEMLYYKH